MREESRAADEGALQLGHVAIQSRFLLNGGGFVAVPAIVTLFAIDVSAVRDELIWTAGLFRRPTCGAAKALNQFAQLRAAGVLFGLDSLVCFIAGASVGGMDVLTPPHEAVVPADLPGRGWRGRAPMKTARHSGIAEIDIWRAARVMVKQCGADAAVQAATRADKWLAAGDIEGQMT